MAFNSPVREIMIVSDTKTTGTSGGANTSGVNEIRVLNTVDYNTITGASLASDEITLPVGTYKISASVPHAQSTAGSRHIAWIQTVAGTKVLTGTSEYAGVPNSGYGMTRSLINGVITVASSTDYVLIHFTEAVDANGLGVARNVAGVSERYAEVIIEKLA